MNNTLQCDTDSLRTSAPPDGTRIKGQITAFCIQNARKGRLCCTVTGLLGGEHLLHGYAVVHTWGRPFRGSHRRGAMRCCCRLLLGNLGNQQIDEFFGGA
jgi:hypothetical protein